MEQRLMHLVEYYSKNLDKTTEEAKPVLSKLYRWDFNDLTIEELYTIRRALEDYAIYSNLLKAGIDAHSPAPKNPFWKRFMKK